MPASYADAEQCRQRRCTSAQSNNADQSAFVRRTISARKSRSQPWCPENLTPDNARDKVMKRITRISIPEMCYELGHDDRWPRGSGEVDVTNPMPSPEWTFLSNHTHVLHCIYLWPEIRIRDIAAKVEITERAVQRIVVDLERGGYLTRERVGRQNHYRLEQGLHLRHPMERHVEVGRLLAALKPRTSALGMPVRKPPGSAAATSRGTNGSAPSPAGAKSLLRLKKKAVQAPKKVAKKPV